MFHAGGLEYHGFFLKSSLNIFMNLFHSRMGCALYCGALMLLYLGSLSSLDAQNIAQPLQVIDGGTGAPLSDVQVTLYAKGQLVDTRYTNMEGRVSLEAGAALSRVALFHAGYLPQSFNMDTLRELRFRIRMEEQTLSLDRIVVAANRWEQDQSELPVRVVEATAADIRFENPQTAADLLATTDEVFVQKSQLGGGSPMMRGFATNRVLLVVDGVRMNNAIFRSGNLQNVISLDAQSIQSTEVVFGPGSVIYGSDALGGVMDFHTLEPYTASRDTVLLDGQVMSRYTSANRSLTSHFDLNAGGSNWASLTSLTYSQYGDQRMGRNGPDAYLRREYVDRIDGRDTILRNPEPRRQRPTGFDQLYLMQKLRYRFNEQWQMQYSGHFSELGEVPRYDRLISRDDKGRLENAEWYYGPQKWQMHSLRLQHEQETTLYDRLKIIGAYQYYEESRFDRDFGDPRLRSRTEKLDIYTFNLDADKSLSNTWQMFYGLEAVRNEVGSFAYREPVSGDGPRDTISTRYPDGAEWSSYAAYSSVKWSATERLTLSGGLRYNQIALRAPFDDRFFNFPFREIEINTGAFTGSLGAVYQLPGNWRVATHFSTGFRAPNIDDAGKIFDSEPGNVVVPNPDLGAEYLYNGEVTVEKAIEGKLRIGATAYYSLLDNVMVRRPFTFNGRDSIPYDGSLSEVEALKNANQATIWGVQARLEYQFIPGLRLKSTYNITEGETQDGAPLRHVAPYFGNTSLRWTAMQGLDLKLATRYSGSVSAGTLAPSEQGKPNIYLQNRDGALFSPSWYTLDLKAGYAPNERLYFNGGIENITDQRYRPYASGVVAPGRNFILSARLRF